MWKSDFPLLFFFFLTLSFLAFFFISAPSRRDPNSLTRLTFSLSLFWCYNGHVMWFKWVLLIPYMGQGFFHVIFSFLQALDLFLVLRFRIWADGRLTIGPGFLYSIYESQKPLVKFLTWISVLVFNITFSRKIGKMSTIYHWKDIFFIYNFHVNHQSQLNRFPNLPCSKNGNQVALQENSYLFVGMSKLRNSNCFIFTTALTKTFLFFATLNSVIFLIKNCFQNDLLHSATYRHSSY